MKKLLSIVLLFVSIASSAQVEKGDKEIGMFGNFNAPTEGSGGNGSLAVTLTNYFSPNVSLGVSMLMSFYTGANYSTGENELKVTPFLGVFGTYNFLTSNAKLLPYVGAEYSFSWVETVEIIGLGTPLVTYEGLHFAGGKAGMKIFMTEMVNFDINLKYQTLLSGPEGYNAGNFGINFGIGVLLPRKP
jgi:outer membrane protein W